MNNVWLYLCIWPYNSTCCISITILVYVYGYGTPCIEEQNHSVNDSDMGNPSILSVFIYFAIHILMYILLCMFLWLNRE